MNNMMLNKLFFLPLVLLGLTMATSTVEAQYNIRVKIADYKNDTLILGYRFGKQTYVKDTCIRKAGTEEFVFAKKDTLDGGVYLVLLKPTNTYFEFLIPDQREKPKDQKNMRIETRLNPDGDLIRDLKITGSPDNTAFIDYLHFLNRMRTKSEGLVKEKEAAKGNAEKEAEIGKKLEMLNDSVTIYQKNLVEKNPNYLSAKLIKASPTPIVPKDIEAQGQEASYRYFKSKYFDGVDWSDARLIRTPIMEEKIEFYLEKLVIQAPDSVIGACEELIGWAKAGKNKDMYQYVSSHLLNKYAKSQVICMDAVYVHLGEKYYCNGGAEWVGKEQLEKICDNVNELRPLRCGSPAMEIAAKNIVDGAPFKLSSLVGKNRYLVLFFWDPACGNCGKAAEKLAPIYNRFKPYGLEVVGICSKEWKDVEDCRKKATEKNMTWINLSDEAYPLAVIKKTYAIKMNPYIYLYDKEMKLMYKRLDPEQVGDIVQRDLQQILDDPNSKEIRPDMRPALKKTLEDAAADKAKREAEEKAKAEKEKATENKNNKMQGGH
jgi:peroxiredoxin